MSLIFSLLAAGCSALSSLFFRKNTDGQMQSASPSGYLVTFYLISLILSFLISPGIWNSEINWIIVSIGAFVGILTSTIMMLIDQALKRGPAGMTFAFMNASAIFPGVILFILLGPEFGYTSSAIQLVGLGLVMLGLFLGTRDNNGTKSSFRWLKFAMACFILQIVALTCIQARCLLFDCQNLGVTVSGFQFPETDDKWFLPGLFGASFLMQAVIFLRDYRIIERREALFGSMGGIANFASTGLLLLATKFAQPYEQSLLFPTFAVAAMILCNIWAYRLYKENFNVKTNLLCSVGIFMGVVG